uniref:SH3 domain-containing protein n=2 Tax=Timema TaxID=61471 RepID=A0A7R8Z8B4_TIMDO|nr:unnamed protein product [Timema douglasi]
MGDNEEGKFEMLKAMYDFKATFAKTLSFHENDIFILHHANTKNRNWWQVVNSLGQVGYVPSNYVAPVKVSALCWLEFLRHAIESVHAEEPVSIEREEQLSQLLAWRHLAEQTPPPSTNLSPVPSATSYSTANCDSLQGGVRDSQLPKRGNLSSVGSLSVRTPGFILSELSREECETVGSLSARTPELSREECETVGSLSARTPGFILSELTREECETHNFLKEETLAQLAACLRGTQGQPRVTSCPSDTSHCRPPGEPLRSTVSTPRGSLPGSPNSSIRGKITVSTCIDVGPETVYRLVEQVFCLLQHEVRDNTQLSHKLSRVAVSVVASNLRDILPPLAAPHLDTILSHLQGPLPVPESIIEETYDARRLRVIFAEMNSCKEDSQQRSWMLHEDESTILDYIRELTSILTNADASVSRHVMSRDKYHDVVSLTQYYQMETRWSIRQVLLQTFGAMCSLDVAVVRLLLNSVLPMELARDMRSNCRNVTCLTYTALLLTMIFSMGEPMPITHSDHLGVDFVTFLLELVENPPDTDVEEQISDLVLNLVISYNLQFTNTAENTVVKALARISVAKTFTEKILLLLNREEDPVRIFDHQPAPPHSVLKLFVDIFTNERTSTLFYTNDTKVLIDIIVRQLTDLSPGDTRRQQYLELCRVVMRNSSYGDHQHRRDDICKCFTLIFCEESEKSVSDQQLVRNISNEFPQFFKK